MWISIFWSKHKSWRLHYSPHHFDCHEKYLRFSQDFILFMYSFPAWNNNIIIILLQLDIVKEGIKKKNRDWFEKKIWKNWCSFAQFFDWQFFWALILVAWYLNDVKLQKSYDGCYYFNQEISTLRIPNLVKILQFFHNSQNGT